MYHFYFAGNISAGEKLVKAGAYLNSANDYGNTPLHSAVLYGKISFMIFVLNNGGRCDRTNQSQQSPLYLAALHMQSDATRLLHQAGYRPSQAEFTFYKQYEANKNKRRRACLLLVFKLYCKPMSLSLMCRTVIRQSFRKVPCLAVKTLQLPTSMQDFLLFKDFLL